MSKKLPSISPGNGTIRKKWLDEPLVKERLLEAQRGGRSFIIDHILENFDHYPDEVDIIRQHFAKHQGDNSNEAFDAIMDKIFGSISIERLSEIEIEAAYYLGGELGIHPGPFTERQLDRMANGKRRSQKRQAEYLAEALKNALENHANANQTPSPILTDRQLLILKALQKLEAIGEDSRKAGKKILPLVDTTTSLPSLKTPLAELKRLGYINSLGSGHAGYWITASGLARINQTQR